MNLIALFLRIEPSKMIFLTLSPKHQKNTKRYYLNLYWGLCRPRTEHDKVVVMELQPEPNLVGFGVEG